MLRPNSSIHSVSFFKLENGSVHYDSHDARLPNAYNLSIPPRIQGPVASALLLHQFLCVVDRIHCPSKLTRLAMGASYSKRTLIDPSKVATKVDILTSTEAAESSNWKAFDYVIVGGGTAGCVMASRLSEDPKTTVLLVEAGQTYEGNLMSSIPLAFSKLFKSDADWNYETMSIYSDSLGNRQIYWPRGKILGGTSAINCLIYHRCAPSDFEEWSRLGAVGWDYKDLLPYFLKAENYSPDPHFPLVKKSDHGFGGPWQVGQQRCEPAPIHQILLETCKSLGIFDVSDLCTASGTLGAAEFMTFTDQSGKRSSAATAYLPPSVMSRSNLKVLTNIMVERILFSTPSENGGIPRAIGVELSPTATGPRYRIHAKQEVILSAGAVASPQILMLSGVGPRRELEKVGVQLVKDLPAVGQHLLDHPSCGTLILRTKSSQKLTWDYIGGPLAGALALLKWLITGGGPMAGLSLPGGAFVRSDDATLPFTGGSSSEGGPRQDNTSGPNAPDIEVIWTPIVVLENGSKRPPSGVDGISMGTMVLRPTSEGSIALKSNSIWDKPLIDPNYLASESDMNVLIRGVRLILRMAHTEPLRSKMEWTSSESAAEQMPWLYPGNANPDEITDDDLKAWIRKNGMATWHPVSTARMGQTPQSSVVDPELKVHGIDGLRVVDASVFPTQVSGHPCSVVIAVAEKAADSSNDIDTLIMSSSHENSDVDVFQDDGPVIVDGDLLEAKKENIQPLASGRRATSLQVALSTPHALRESKLAATRNRLRINVEVALEDEDDDPLEAFCQLVYWTVENYPEGHSAESGLLELLEEATRVLKDDRGGAWRGDLRYLKLWVLYATYVEKPTIIFRYLMANEIGTSFSLLYEEFAAVLERNGRRTEADDIYLLGLNRQANPIQRLKSKHREFQKRMMSAAPIPETPPSPPPTTNTTTKRKILGDSTVPKTSTRQSRTASVSGTSSTQPQGSAVGSGPTTRSRSNARLQVFVDPTGSEAQAVADSSITPWEELGTRKTRVKENVPEVSKAKGTILKQPGRHHRLASVPSGSRIPIFRDPPADSKEMPPPAAPVGRRADKEVSQTRAKPSFVPFRDEAEASDARPSTPKFTPFRDEPTSPSGSSSNAGVPESVMKVKRIGGKGQATSSEAEALRKDPFKNYEDPPVDID
ncbi:hypothetical protein EW146_g5923 [Bondarzewia mesenterica]|uniref:BUB1 N-terminal domain-containing protein n=1 Tax=Bondarzewia mesenterica TaxID=1095465 RepID=A0A4V3XEP5_9AGAM|nr:hypothetical protein EW146_g5923 [Bondarzewia mesenterica]